MLPLSDLGITKMQSHRWQRSMVAAKLATMKQGERTDLLSIDKRLSEKTTADLLNVSRPSVARAGRPGLTSRARRRPAAASIEGPLSRCGPHGVGD